MAKSIRSKVKKRNRSIMRRTVGKEFNDRVLAKTEAIRVKSRGQEAPKNLAVSYGAAADAPLPPRSAN